MNLRSFALCLSLCVLAACTNSGLPIGTDIEIFQLQCDGTPARQHVGTVTVQLWDPEFLVVEDPRLLISNVEGVEVIMRTTNRTVAAPGDDALVSLASFDGYDVSEAFREFELEIWLDPAPTAASSQSVGSFRVHLSVEDSPVPGAPEVILNRTVRLPACVAPGSGSGGSGGGGDPGCPVGDLVFSWITNNGSTPVNGLLTFADLGGEVCRAVPWENGGEQVWPTVSPLERQVAYVARYDPGVSGRAIYVVPIDGSVDPNHQQDDMNSFLADGRFSHLAWAPDGNWIAAAEGDPGRLVVVRVSDGRAFDVPRVGLASNDRHPTWAPDQSRIYFTTGPADLAVVDVGSNNDGTLAFANPRVLVRSDDPDLNAVGVFGFYDPSCSPDGSQIAFRNNEPGGRVFVYRTSDGAITQNVSSGGTGVDLGDHDPTWWDDDTIVFTRFVDVAQGFQAVLFQVRAGGANEAEITDENGQRLDGDASQAAVVPATLRRP